MSRLLSGTPVLQPEQLATALPMGRDTAPTALMASFALSVIKTTVHSAETDCERDFCLECPDGAYCAHSNSCEFCTDYVNDVMLDMVDCKKGAIVVRCPQKLS
jgi:hypothetical protein